jgi:hypothetical protein
MRQGRVYDDSDVEWRKSRRNLPPVIPHVLRHESAAAQMRDLAASGITGRKIPARSASRLGRDDGYGVQESVSWRATPHVARRLRSTSVKIRGVRMSCMARSTRPPGTTMEFARDMKLIWIIDNR